MLASALIFLPGHALSQPAPDANSVLILSSVDADGFYAARATALGLTVVTATDVQWGARTTADFATFRTFDWAATPGAAGSDAPLQLRDKNIRAAIAAEMKRKGYTESQDSPDLRMSDKTAKDLYSEIAANADFSEPPDICASVPEGDDREARHHHLRREQGTGPRLRTGPG